MKNGGRAERYFPPNVIATIFSNLGIYEIARCACVSKSWWSASYPEIPNGKAKLKDAWLNGDFEPIVVGEVEMKDFKYAWLEGNALAACGKGFLRLWNIDEDTFINASENVGSKTLLNVCFFDGKIFTGDDKGYITAWDPSNGNDLFSIEAHGMGVSALFRGGNYLASGGVDSKVKLWRKPRKRGGLKCRVLKGHTARVDSVHFSIDGKLLFSGSDDTTIRVWDIASRECIHVIEFNARVWKVEGVMIAGENGVLGASVDENVLRAWELSSGTVHSRVAVNSIMNFSYDELHDWYVVGYNDTTIKVWDSLEAKHCLRDFRLDSEVAALEVVQNRLCVLAKSGKILLWDPSK